MHSKSILGLAALLALSAASPGGAQQQIQVLPVQGNVYLVSGAGGNITLQTGKDGVLLVDTGLAAAAPAVIAAIRKVTTAPVLFIINTHVHPDHVGGNEAVAETRGESGTAGPIVPAGGGGRPPERLDGEQQLKIIAHENVLNRLTAPGKWRSSAA